MVSAFALAHEAKAQTNLQTLYDFANDRGYITTTLEGFYTDKWGNTFFFVDHDFATKDNGHVYAPSGTYAELARCLNFWQNTALAPFSLQLEYNGGVYNGFTINNAYLAGVDWFLHSADFKNTLNLKVLYKNIDHGDSKVPMQFTVVWGFQDLFGVQGLRFSGFADFWWEDHVVDTELSRNVFISEPQLWYNIGRHIGVPNLNLGGEVELSYDFGTVKGFKARPCLGAKWVF